MAINERRVEVAFDLNQYAKEHGFYLSITEKQVEIMIKEGMYSLIEKLCITNSLYKIDPMNLDAEELFQVQQIASKK